MLQGISQHIQICGIEIHVRWILAHVRVPDKEEADMAAVKAPDWREEALCEKSEQRQ